MTVPRVSLRAREDRVRDLDGRASVTPPAWIMDAQLFFHADNAWMAVETSIE